MPRKLPDPHPCECGCGETTQYRFVRGHDMRVGPFALGRTDGEAAGLNAWAGSTHLRVSLALPVKHAERQRYLAGFASGLAEYNRLIEAD